MTQLYSKLYTPDTTGGVPGSQLFMTNNGGTVQMTGTSLVNNGWAWCNGLLMQWGQVLNPGSSGNVVFKDRVAGAIPFPNNIFNIQLTLQRGSAGQIATINNIPAPTKLGFSYLTSSPGSNILYWFAVGN